MVKYFFKRLFRGIISVVIAVGIIMILIYSLLDNTLIFAEDAQYMKLGNNQKILYMYQMWKNYGYVDYVSYSDYLNKLVADGEIDEEFRESIASIGRTPDKDSKDVKEYVKKFTDYYEDKGYTILRLDAVMASKRKVATGGTQALLAYQNKPVLERVISYFGSVLTFDNIHYVKEDIGKRGLTFTLHDPAYGGDKFAPAIIGNGTKHKYLLYVDSRFPFVHQNFVKITLGTSYSINKGIDVFETMTQTQGSYVVSPTYYPSGIVAESADDLHTATYAVGSREANLVYKEHYTDDYTNVSLTRNSGSRIAYSFVIGIIGSIITYFIGLPLGILMAKKKDTWVDRLGNAYVIFMIAVPGLAYIFMFKAIGNKLGLPTTFSLDNPTTAMYIMPILSSVVASVAGTMRWMRRYMVDQMNSDYVKFARSEGLTEGEIFTKHIFKNAAIPVTHGIPSAFVGALAGSIVTERVYLIPGVGGLLVQAIGAYDNSVIVGVAIFYGMLYIIAAIMGDIVMAIMDPRISFTSKAR
ncbi:MAG: ABC transporter permease [Coprococcus sp.]|nr:ABC transporter permease [Coprococcus sp.]